MRLEARIFSKFTYLRNGCYKCNSVEQSRRNRIAIMMDIAYILQSLAQKDFIRISNMILGGIFW